MNQFFILVFCSLNFSLGRGQSCETPNKIQGQCIVIRSCDSLFDIVKKSPVSEENILFLRQSQCGVDGNQPKVCCPLDNKGETSSTIAPADVVITSKLLPDAQTCGQSDSDRIVGGKLVGLKEYPWMALLNYDTDEGPQFKCGGALINDRYVLTAAHCVQGIPPEYRLVGVRLGENQLDTDPDCENSEPGFQYCADKPIDVGFDKKIVHENYVADSINQHYDIALLRLNQTIDITGQYVKPICLPTSLEVRKTNFEGKSMIVAGWGRTEVSRQSNLKLQVEIPVIAQTRCVSAYANNGRFNRTIVESQLCAGGIIGEDSCSGDSGGPLMLLHKTDTQEIWYAYGVVSFGPRFCGRKDLPGTYTRVQHYLEWIVSHLKP